MKKTLPASTMVPVSTLCAFTHCSISVYPIDPSVRCGNVDGASIQLSTPAAGSNALSRLGCDEMDGVPAGTHGESVDDREDYLQQVFLYAIPDGL